MQLHAFYIVKCIILLYCIVWFFEYNFQYRFQVIRTIW